TKPFLKLISKTVEVPLLLELFSDLPGQLFDSSDTCTLHLCQKIIDLEGYMGGPLPLALIKKIIRKIPLNAIDQKDLDQWILKIDAQKIPVQTVHKTLKAITDIYAKKTTSEKSRQELTTEMELFLENNGCKIFSQNDGKHLEWRQRLEKGQKILFNQSENILGTEIFPDLAGSDKTRAYTIEGQTDRIALIANNCVALSLRDQRMRKENQTDIKAVLAIDISTDGRIALFERLKALNTIRWTSNEGRISPEDNPMVNVLAELVRDFIKENFTPSNFSSCSLMLNEQMQLNFVKPISRSFFDFNAIENFFTDCSAGNQLVFQALMERSGLDTHSVALFYRDVVKNTLNGENNAHDDLAAIYKISDPKVVDRADILSGRIKNLKKKMVMQLREETPGKLPDELERQANRTLLARYSSYKLC
ncbi:MAG TPA: hypothetical protein VGP47_04420, partial [Parachlamydiaceae bacterium]|nr:hypothetical protein [Parachlamydiaceae bacterium]